MAAPGGAVPPGTTGKGGGLAGLIKRKPAAAGAVALAGAVGVYALVKSRSSASSAAAGQTPAAATSGTSGYADTGSTPYTYGGGDNGSTADLTSGFETQTAALQAQLAAITNAGAASNTAIAKLTATDTAQGRQISALQAWQKAHTPRPGPRPRPKPKPRPKPRLVPGGPKR